VSPKVIPRPTTALTDRTYSSDTFWSKQRDGKNGLSSETEKTV